MRRIVFIGNCQVQLLEQLYRRYAGREGEEQILYLPSYEDLTPERSATIASADVIVEQRLDVAPKAEIDGNTIRGERWFVPLLAGGFLWPFAGQPHPRNERLWFMPSGPFDGEMSDSYLNRLIEKRVPAEEAVAQYLALDVNKIRNLDRLFEIIIDRQRARDNACGYQFADLIVEHFRHEPLFRTPHHPNLRLSLAFGTQFFRHMGLAEAAIARLHERVRVTPFPRTQAPIHPSVAAHFGLAYADAQTRYRIREEGRFTFAEYAARYMAGEWNRELAEGIATAGSDLAAGIAMMESGLQRSPGSPEGWYSYGEALRRAGRLADAEAAARKAIAIDPLEPRHFYGLGHTLAEAGRLDEAAESAERALVLDPLDPHFHGLATNLALRRGRLAEAEALARRAISIIPDQSQPYGSLADVLQRQDRAVEAEAAFREALARAPDNAWLHFMLSRHLVQLGRQDEALELARSAAALDAGNTAIQGHLATLLADNDADTDNPEARLQVLLAARPDDAALHEQYGHLLVRLGRLDEAISRFRLATELAPDSAAPLSALSHALARHGQAEAAIEAILAAIKAQPQFAPFHVHLGNQLRIVGRSGPAEAAYQAALAIDRANQQAQDQLRSLRVMAQVAG